MILVFRITLALLGVLSALWGAILQGLLVSTCSPYWLTNRCIEPIVYAYTGLVWMVIACWPLVRKSYNYFNGK